jgi:hypothetical protein
VKIPATRSGKARIWPGAIPGTFEPGFVELSLVEQPVPEAVRQRVHGDERGLELHHFTMGACRILLGREPQGVHGELRWHLTISCRDRHPSWDEIKTARYRLLGPDTVMAMLLPQVQFYVNMPEQDHVFQLWEIEDEARVWEIGP